MYGKAIAILTRLLNAFSATLFIIMAALVVLQVFYRYVLNSPLTGSEEAARAILIYIVILGAAAAVGNRSHLTINYFYDLFPSSIKKIATLFYFITILGIALLFIIQGWDLAQRTMFQTTPALRIPKGFIVYAFPIGGVLMCLYAIGLLISIWGAPKRPGSSSKKQ